MTEFSLRDLSIDTECSVWHELNCLSLTRNILLLDADSENYGNDALQPVGVFSQQGAGYFIASGLQAW